jgi:hypothetical protein
MPSKRTVLTLTVLASCAHPATGPELVRPSEPRATLVGNWTLILTVDSTQRLVQEPHMVRSIMDPIPPVLDSGTLEVFDTLIPSTQWGDELRSRVHFDFQRLLGRPPFLLRSRGWLNCCAGSGGTSGVHHYPGCSGLWVLRGRSVAGGFPRWYLE